MKLLLTIILICSFSGSTASYSNDSTDYVWICTGKAAYSYHNNRGCRGLNRCKAKIKKVTLEKACSMKRSPCEICYK